ncbi:MAG: acyl-CoA dehydrogenase [Halobacteriovoraceae bacterium]|nr:acyl-CoA dehydrogenase [Halobacteriovoraceae bacterium]|tara:strand:+ start:1422 stop:3107 length:1686 start_codon:yes stop_codon:yes gene_type:complete
MTHFFQEPPQLKNQYEEDELLQLYLEWKFSKKELKIIQKDLHRFGKRVVTDILALAQAAEDNMPRLEQFDPWGNRIDEIKTSAAWKELDRISAEEGLISHGYQRKYKELSRLYQLSKLYLFHASSAFYSCPLAMTDGAARLIELYGDQELKHKAFQHIISQNPDEFWTSGQWMTEKTGGSDVSQSETIARFEDNEWKLYGVKWFTSATTSQMTMALARIEEEGKIVPGSKGLSLFYIELRDEAGKLNNIEILRLKDKLGTDALPTAELKLNGTKTKLVGEKGQGVKTISSLFNITRIYNACCSLSASRRILVLAKDYAQKRTAFNKKIIQHPLHNEILSQAEQDWFIQFMLVFNLTELLGADECQKTPVSGLSSEDIAGVLRILTPIAKLFTAKKTLSMTSELLESFGGAGYIENTRIPRLLRDAQVFPIWEGTTNVLSLDVLRSIAKENSLSSLIKYLSLKMKNIDLKLFSQEIDSLMTEMKKTESYFRSTSSDEFEPNARNISFNLAQLSCAVFCLEFASAHPKHKKYTLMAKRYCAQLKTYFFTDSGQRANENLEIIK